MTHSPPNVLLIVLDSVRKDHLSCYGYSRATTPNIDRIAGEGVRHTRASAASCWTLPSHASMFTGLYPSEHRADLDTNTLHPRHATIASYLRGLGYRTASLSCNSFVSSYTGLTHGCDTSVDVERMRGGTRSLGGRAVRAVHRQWRHLWRQDRGARRATQGAQAWLREHGREGPFFMFLNYMDCHLPYRLRRPERHRFVAPEDRKRVDAVPQDPFAVMAGRLSLSARDLDDLQALYDGSLAYLDQQVGILDAQLERLGLSERTLLIVTSDHGESFGDHGLMDHQYGLYQNLIGVPLVMRFPDGVRAGQVDDRLVQHVDLLPTVADLLGRAPDELPAVTGRSVLGEPREAAFSEYLVPSLRTLRRRFPGAEISRFETAIRSVSTERHKLIWRSDGETELYDLECDPDEASDLAAIRPDLVSQLQALISARLGGWPQLHRQGPPEVMEQVRDRLEALGYL